MIKEMFTKQFILFDGAMGTLLQQRGVVNNELPPLINLSNKELIKEIHLEYLSAGSDVIVTNTFSINSEKIGSKEVLKNVIKNAISAASEAVETFGKGFIAYDIGPIGQLIEPNGTMKFSQAYKLFAEQVKCIDEKKVDLVLLETFTDLLELKAAVLAVKENSSLPIIASMSFDNKLRTFSGATPESLVVTLEGLGVDALGVNCSSGPKGLLEIVKRIEKISSTPIIAKPNAGIPELVGSKTIFNLSPKDFAMQMTDLIYSKASIIGGCCGTTPKDIKILKDHLKGLNFEPLEQKDITAASSGVKTVFFDKNFVKVGERINPTGKKMLKRAIRKEDIDYIVSEAINQVEEGSDILDINLNVVGVKEIDIFKKVIKPIQAVVDAPLQIDSTEELVFKEILREYNGKAIINSVNGKKSSLESILPIAKKYGALIIGLTLDEKGLPKNALERYEIARKIIRTAKRYGISKKNIIIDCLTLTASAQPDQVYETLKAIKMIKEKLKVKTILGASNISFGLPDRELINTVFLVKAREFGLDSAIINTKDKLLIKSILADDVLRNIDEGANKYIANNSFFEEEEKDDLEASLEYAVVKGLSDTAKRLTVELLENHKPLDVIDNYLLPALNKVGYLYETGAIYLPQLIQSAQVAKRCFHIINAKVSKNIDKSDKKVILATVEGDIHDIGKNIAKILLENYGFEVIDLGKDVSVKDIITALNNNNIKLIGLSALMTTSVVNMKKTINILKRKFPHIRIMVGGAVLTEKYALEIKADFYAKDAQEGVRIAKSVYK